MYAAQGNRYQTMAYRRCGRSGLKLPRISLGLWHNSRVVTLTVPLILAAMVLSACLAQGVNELAKQEPSAGAPSQVDLDNDGKEDTFSLTAGEGSITIQVNESTLDLDLIGKVEESDGPVLQLLTSNDNEKHLMVSYFNRTNGGVSNKQSHLFVVRYTGAGLEALWDGHLTGYKHRYENNRIFFSFPGSAQEIEIDITSDVEVRTKELARIEPLTIDEFYNGPIDISLSDVGAMDYDGDGQDEIITRYDVRNEQYYSYLCSIYAMWQVSESKVHYSNGMLADVTDEESWPLRRIVEAIMEKGTLEMETVEAWDEEAGEGDYRKRIDRLVQEGILQVQGTDILFAPGE